MNEEFAYSHLLKLINQEEYDAVEHILEFLNVCQPSEETKQLYAFFIEKKSAHMKEHEEVEKEKQNRLALADRVVRDTFFNWEEVVDIMDDVGRCVVFKSTSEPVIFTRYESIGRVMRPVSKITYWLVDDLSEDALTKYKHHRYQVESTFSAWNSEKIAQYINDYKEISTSKS